jgi:hypothetical protein
MLEVHPPHHVAHTWKDFFIHIATICVGLLIAVGLEQMVEYFHRQHQRHQLEQQLSAEAGNNSRYIAYDIQVAEAYLDWALSQASVSATAGDRGPLTLRRMPPGLILFPDTGVWFAAKDSGQVSLLDADEQVFMTDMYRVEGRAFATSTGAWDLLLTALSGLDSTLETVDFPPAAETVNLSQFNPAQRAGYTARLAQVAAAARDLDRELVYYQFYNDGALKRVVVRDGDEQIEDNLRLRQQRTAEHPGTQFHFHAR